MEDVHGAKGDRDDHPAMESSNELHPHDLEQNETELESIEKVYRYKNLVRELILELIAYSLRQENRPPHHSRHVVVIVSRILILT